MRRFATSLLFASAFTALTACAIPPDALLKQFGVEPDEFAATDARLRIITNSDIGAFSRPGLVDPIRIVCTEPSPDVATAVASSFGAGLSVLGYGSGSISQQTVEAMAQLVERTASIQLMRDKMYQTCLAYSNGAISGTTYNLIMSRLDDTMVTLLLGETAGGAFGRRSASLDTAASAEAEASLVSLPAGMGEINDSVGKVAEQQRKLDALDGQLAAAKTAAEGIEDPNSREQKEVTRLQGERDQAKRELDALLMLLQAQTETTAKAVGKATALGAGGIDREPNPQIAATLGDMQSELLNADPADRYVSACLSELSLQTETGFGKAEQAISTVIDQLRLMGAAQATAMESGDLNKAAEIGKEIENQKRVIKDMVDKYLDKSESQALNTSLIQLFQDFREQWKTGNPTIDTIDYISAAYTNRASALANFCKDRLPEFLLVAKHDSQEYRLRRLQLSVEVDKVEAEARLRDAEADRLANLQQLGPALTACQNLSADDQKVKCFDLVLSGSVVDGDKIGDYLAACDRLTEGSHKEECRTAVLGEDGPLTPKAFEALLKKLTST